MTVFPAFGMPGGFEWVLIFLVVLLVFGAKRLPEIARSIGKASNEFKKARREFSEVVDEVTDDSEPPKPAKPAKPAKPEAASETDEEPEPPKTT